jgi:hypothetical protein
MPNDNFRALAAAAEKDPTTADFPALRQAYINSDDYRPTSHFSHAKLKGNTNHCANFDEVAIFCQKILDDNPMDLEARMLLEFAYDQLEQHDLAANTHAFVGAMLDAIYHSGSGESLETARSVVAVAEEYTLLSVMGLKLIEQALIEENDRYYDKMICKPRGQAEADSIDLYFDITAPYTFLQNMLE